MAGRLSSQVHNPSEFVLCESGGFLGSRSFLSVTVMVRQGQCMQLI